MKLICVRDEGSEGRLTKGKLYYTQDNLYMRMINIGDGGLWYSSRFEYPPEVDVRTCFHCKMTDPASDEGGDDSCNHLWIDP